MRLLTFSFLRNCKFKPVYSRRCYSQPSFRAPENLRSKESVLPKEIKDNLKGDPNLIQVAASWPPEEQVELRIAALRDMQVLPDFITEEEEASLLAELEPVLKRMRYEFDHWDNAIHGFRETERSTWRPENEAVFKRVKDLAFSIPDAGEPLPHQHVLDLAPSGHIKPHVDAVRFCGNVIAGLCLASTAIMRLVHEKHKHLVFDALLPQRGLYIMKGVSRYDFSHAVVGGEESVWRGERVLKKRRVAVICRSKPPPVHD
ncbi:hypothetical protein O0L34_g14185 [Tuta absoluta]|nr:hypothetical protein O0L34_g14185 [Tuta absoluta]